MFPLPQVAAPHLSRSQSRRCQQRSRRAAAVTSYTNSAVCSLNSLHVNLSTSLFVSQPRNVCDVPCCSFRSVEHVQSCCEHFVRRLAPDFQVPESVDDDFMLRDTSDLFTAAYSFKTDAMELEADRVALPDVPGSVNLVDVLPPEIAQAYSEPNPDLFRPVEEQKSAPHAHLVRSPEDYTNIIRRLHELGMVRFVLEPKCVNGCFGTPKSDGKIRFVVDGRPAKWMFVPCPKMQMTSPDHLARLEVPAGKQLYVAKADLDNMFHRFRTPEWMHPYFALPHVRAGDVGMGADFGDDTMIYPCCTTLPMGWSHSAYLAQTAHEHLINTRTTLRPADRIVAGNDFLADRIRHSVYIDDMGVMGTDPAEVDAKLAEYEQAMARAGLPLKMSKTVWASADGVELIGVVINGRGLTIGVAPAKLLKLIRRTEALLRVGRCTGKDMERLMGHWTWAVLARRPALAVFCGVYRFMECAGKKVFDIWPTVARELRCIIGLAPLLFASLKPVWFHKAIATDASDTGMGVSTTPASPAALREMSLARPPCDNGPVDRSLHPALRGRKWADIVSVGWRYPEHINALELHALDTAVRWCASHPTSVGCRLVLWCDSLVVVWGVRKGRTSKWRLLRRLRRLNALLLATGITAYVNWIPTEVNPADEPSRQVFGGSAVPPCVPGPDPDAGFEFDSTLGYPGEGPPRRCFLTNAAQADKTREKYADAVLMFVDWMDATGEAPDTVEELDEVLTEWFHDLFITRGGACRSYAESALNGVHRILPSVKGQLHYARLALKGWRRKVPSIPYPPLTWDVTVVVAARLLAKGRRSLALAALLAFDCYLRVGELMALTRGDVADAGDRRMGSGHRGMALRLKKTKTGTNQWVTVRNPDVVALVRQRLSEIRVGSSARLFPYSTSTFRKHFKAACSDLGLSSDYVPHSLRHGGATHDHARGLPLEDILRHGRWASVKSARHYVQAGRALLMSTSVPDAVTDLAGTFVPHIQQLFALSQDH